ncbi:ester cyclase [Actinophytocola sp.]|uniref:ester cyclase n=1 Tax=Actinophytocola sp. TaxID=1872138 RepID=UPI002ED54A77
MTPDERRDLLRRVNDRMWNEGDLDACDELFASNCSFHDPSFPVDGVAGLKEQIRELRAAYPDLHMDLHEILVDGDLTAARWTMGATSRGEFRGIPATGKSYVMTGMECEKWEGDRVVETWINYDLFGALQQTGVIPETVARESTS